MKNSNLDKFLRITDTLVKKNARIRYIPDENGIYKPYELLCFSDATFIPRGFEKADVMTTSDLKKSQFLQLQFDEPEVAAEASASATTSSAEENRRKSYCRARNKLFDILTCTLDFDCFVTLTLDEKKVARTDYNEVIKKLNVWLSNKVQRQGLVYALVPEFHSDKKGIHFHGLMNSKALKLIRSMNAHSGKPIFDDSGREVYNISDFKLGFSTCIPLSGENCRIATAKYCYKYITKTRGEKVGGRYYLSGGNLGRPRYKLIDIDYMSINCEARQIGNFVSFKKLKLTEETISKNNLEEFL